MTSNQQPSPGPGPYPASLGNGVGSAPGWDQPSQSTQSTGLEVPLPSLRAPMAVAATGLLFLLIGAVLFVRSMTMATPVTPETAVPVPHDATSTSVDLLADQLYGFYSQDAGAQCTVKDPSGVDVEVSALPSTAQASTQQVLAFTTRAKGAYSVSCEATREVTVNLAMSSAPLNRAQSLFMLSFPFMGVGVMALLVGSTWLTLRRRARSALIFSRLHSGLAHQDASLAPQPGAAPQWGQAPTGPSAPSAPSSSYGIAPQQVVYRPVPSQGDRPPVEPPR